MKGFTLVIVFLFCKVLFGQELTISGKVVYNHIRTTQHGETSRAFNLLFNQKQSYYVEQVKGGLKEIKETKDDIVIMTPSRKNNNPEFYYFDENQNLYFSSLQIDTHLFVKEDDDFSVKWELVPETKKIGEFNCQKAIGIFRGRDYVAWFANDVPVSFGPWKLNGLPGLILEVYDDTGLLHIVAQDIQIDSQEMFSKELSDKVTKINFNKVLTIDEFVEEKNRIVQEYFNQLSSRMPKGYGPIKVSENCIDCGQELEVFN
jgi:GLPGLI family protein